MNEITERKMTTRQVADYLGTSSKVVLTNARKCLPNKVIENGKTTYWSNEEVTVLIEQLKCNQPNGYTFPNLSVELKGGERCERNSTITTMQFAKQLGTSPNVILDNARECLPSKVIINGKPTFWTKEEVTILLDYMKSHNSNNRSVEFNSTVKNTSTTLTPALKIKKAFELMQEGYEEELSRLRQENIEQKQKLLEQKEDVEFSKSVQADEKSCFTMSQVAQELKLPYGNIGLFRKLRELKILKNDNCPYQQYVDMGLFKVYPKIISVKDTTKTVLVTLATQKGVAFINAKLKLRGAL